MKNSSLKDQTRSRLFSERPTGSGLRFALLLCLALACAPGAAEQTVRAPEHEFFFVVLGDSQFDGPQVFNRMIEDVSQIGPSLVIQVGDMISGYTDDAGQVRSQWRRFRNQLAPLGGIPFFPVPGNHDVLGANGRPNPQLERIYRETWGDLYYSFDYRNAHFVVLDTDYRAESGRIGPEQLQWLEKDLEQSRDKDHILVFFHRPMMDLENRGALHRTFVRYGVRAVFYGHRHHYEYYEEGGIGYAMTNATGSMGTDIPEAGNFPHFILASVRDRDFRFAVIKADSIEMPAAVAPADNAGIFQLQTRLLAEEEIPRKLLAQTEDGYRVVLRLSNPSAQDVTVYFQWEPPDRRWEVSPGRGMQATLKAGSRDRAVEFFLKRTDASQPEGWPVCRIEVPYLTTRGEWVTVKKTFQIK
ncbi:MAG: metallophosphoesterase [Acidobacteria bacterium]|nr:metallophosphoesterase [Acidobacteriota bacterium]